MLVVQERAVPYSYKARVPTYVMLNDLFYPRTVAVIGASSKEGSLGYHVMQNNIHLKAEVYPVHPVYEEVMARKVYRSVRDIPEDIDVAISVVGPDNTLQITKECAEAKVKFLIIVTSRFGEAARFKEGKVLEQKILKAAEESGMRIVGPNCIGVLNIPFVNSTFLPDYSPFTLEGMPIPPKGNINIISESGSVSGLLTAWLEEQRLGLNKLVNYGNGIDLVATDFMEYFQKDTECDVVGLYIEGIRNGRRFMKTARDLNEKKPVVILKPGSELASKAALSHTGSVATNDAILDGALKQAHVNRARTYGEFCAAVMTHSMVSDRFLNRDHFFCVGITNAGGFKVLLAESLRQYQVPESTLSVLSPGVVSELERILPPNVTVTNPLDIVGDASSETYSKVMETLLAEDNVDCVLSIPSFEPASLREELVKDTARLMVEYGKPVIIASVGGELARIIRDKFQKVFILNFDKPEDLAFAYQILRKRHQFLTKTPLPADF
ncbi:MAG: CoA-binding protein [Theionarchaea archaeon]|nr:CoA-binding protein [Theionarchaea archaeon]